MDRLHRITGHLFAEQKQLNANATGGARPPMKVLVTGAAGNIAYSALFMIGNGAMLGMDQQIELVLLDIPPMAKAMAGVEMELRDAAFPLVTSITSTTDYEVAFKDVDIALLIGAKPRGKGMVRADLLAQNGKIFEGQGKALDKWASRNVKVLVVGNPCNTNCLIAMNNAPSLSPSCFAAMTRLDELRAKGQIALRLGVAPEQVKNIFIWGNHSATMYPDLCRAYVADYPSAGHMTPVRDAVGDDKWLDSEWIKTIQKRGAAIIQARGKSSAASAANAAVSSIRTWVCGTPPGEIVNMAVPSDGSYGIPRGLICSMPVTCNNGQIRVVQGLPVDARSRRLIDTTAAELSKEKATVGL